MLVGGPRRDQRDEVVEKILEIGEQRVFLRREVSIEGAVRHGGGLGDVADRDGIKSALRDQSLRRERDGSAGGCLLLCAPTRYDRRRSRALRHSASMAGQRRAKPGVSPGKST